MALIGLMAAGKSAVGRMLADPLGVRFVDTDAIIEAETGQMVRELWEAGGEATYRPGRRGRRSASGAQRRRVRSSSDG